jgi:hypothetical protein
MTEIENLAIKDDSGWKDNTTTSRPWRGIHDFQRVIEFHVPIKSNDKIQEICRFFDKNDSPGWVGVTCTASPRNDRTYVFHTTFDSSD